MGKNETCNIGVKYEGFRFLRFGFVEQDDCNDEALGIQLFVDIDDTGSVLDGKAKIFVKVAVLFVRDGEKEIAANIETVSQFGLEGVRNEVDEKVPVKYPQMLLTTLVSLAISTTRGAVLAKGAGSFLEMNPLPIVDPKAFVGRSPEKQGSVSG